MTQYLIRRLLLAVPVVIGVTFFAYSMVLLTGDRAAAIAGQHVTPEIREAVRERLGLDDPLPVQYARFLGRIARGDFGISIISRIPVATELRLFLPATMELAMAAMTIAIVIGVPLGVFAAYKHNSFSDLGTTFGAWQRQARLLRALEVMAAGQNVTAAALEVGFETPSAFIAMFRRAMGTTPAKYFRGSESDPQTNTE